MIFVSSSCVRNTKVVDSVKELVEAGFTNIELSGGTQVYPGLLSDLKKLKKEGVNYLMHNYFPPPAEPFVLNLASLDENISTLSLNHCFKALELCNQLEVQKFGVHAGFLINIPVNQIGKGISKTTLFNRSDSLEKFKDNYHLVLEKARSYGVELYLENNVLSKENYDNFNENPFFLVSSGEISFFEQEFNDFKLLFDYGHGFVSATTLSANVTSELDSLTNKSDYIHISDNNGLADQNLDVQHNSVIFNHILDNIPKNKTITLEIYSGIENIRKSYNWLNDIISE